MNSFKIEIEVNLGQDTVDALRQIFGPRVQAPAVAAEKPVEQIEPKQPVMETKSAAPQPAPAVDDDDLPPGNAPDPVKPTPSESDTRNAVQAARKRGVPAGVIKAYMKDRFGIATSVECPAERRQELIDGLAQLAA